MIKVSGIHVHFGKTHALDGIDLKIDKGECLLLAGANGSGKTTLLRSVAGVLSAHRGEVTIDGINVGPGTRLKTAYIPSTLSFYDSLRLKEAVALHASFYPGFSYREIGGFKFDMARKAGSLSRGEKTLFSLSLALSSSPAYLLVDDVIHFLDPHLREIFLNTIMELMEEEQLAVVIAAQSAADIEGVLERVLLLDRGKAALDASVESLKRSCVRVYTDQEPRDAEAGPPVIYHRKWNGMNEIYIYPFEEHMKPAGRIEHLTLTEILRAFIGGEYGMG
jgi:ABC-2 type transport system ATP-binding protein